MNDIPTFALLLELYNRMTEELYEPKSNYDAVLTDMPHHDTMEVYFLLEEYILAYKELINQRNHMQG